jgi:hypothetical protein
MKPFCLYYLTTKLDVTPGPSKLEKVVDPGSRPQGPLPEIGFHYLNLHENQVVDPDFR